MTKITAGLPHPSRYSAVDIPQDNAELVAKVRQLTAGLSADNGDLLAAFPRLQHRDGYGARGWKGEAPPALDGGAGRGGSQAPEGKKQAYQGTLASYEELRAKALAAW